MVVHFKAGPVRKARYVAFAVRQDKAIEMVTIKRTITWP